MSVDYEQLKLFVKEAMFTGGGINTPSAPEDVPHRMPAAEPPKDKGDPQANKLYDIALAAREATEKLVEALDDPTFDDAYAHAFRASASLRKVLNSIINQGARPEIQQRVVAPPRDQQKYFGSGGFLPMTFSSGGEMEEQVEGVPQQDAPAKGRLKKVAAAAQQGGTQSVEEIQQQLSAVILGKGISPIKLRAALVGLLGQLGLKNAKQVGTLVAKAVAAQQKKRTP